MNSILKVHKISGSQVVVSTNWEYFPKVTTAFSNGVYYSQLKCVGFNMHGMWLNLLETFMDIAFLYLVLV